MRGVRSCAVGAWLVAFLVAVFAIAMPPKARAQAPRPLNVQIVNQSGVDDGEIYLLLQGGQSSDGKLPSGVPVTLGDIAGSQFRVAPGGLSGRMYISYGAPVQFDESNTSPTRYDKVEITYPGQGNLTAVDFFGIAMDLQTVASNGTVLETRVYQCYTDIVSNSLLSIPGAGGALVGTPEQQGGFVRILSPQIDADSYPGFAQYVQSLAGTTVEIDTPFLGTAVGPNPDPWASPTDPLPAWNPAVPSEVQQLGAADIDYEGTFQSDGTITLSGSLTQASPTDKRFLPAAQAVTIPGAGLTGTPSQIYTVNGPYSIGGAGGHVVGENDAFSSIYRDLIAGLASGYVGGAYGNSSSGWQGQPPFAQARSRSAPYATYNEYAATIYEYSDSYGFGFSDTGPKKILIDLGPDPSNSALDVATLVITILPDTSPQTPECPRSSSGPGAPSPSPPPTPPTVHEGKLRILGRRVKVDRRRRIPLRFKCTGDPCKGTLELATSKRIGHRAGAGGSATRAADPPTRKKGKRKPTRLGSTSYSISAGKKQRLMLKLTKRAIRDLRRSRHHRMKAKLSAYGGASSLTKRLDRWTIEVAKGRPKRGR